METSTHKSKLKRGSFVLYMGQKYTLLHKGSLFLGSAGRW